MARVTVEDCLDHVDNRFDLVQLATKRARQLAYGKEPLVGWENDKPTVVALREIAEGLISEAILDESENAASEEELVGGVEISQEDMESVSGIEALAPQAVQSTEEASEAPSVPAAAIEIPTTELPTIEAASTETPSEEDSGA